MERAKNQFGELVEKAGGFALPVLSKSMEGWNFIFEGLTGTGRFESYEDMLKRMRALNEAALKAEKQARLNAIEKANKEEMDLLIKTQNETVAVEQEFSKKVFQLNQNQFGLMEIARREDLAKFKGTNADRWAVLKYYEDLENKLRQDRQAKELEAVQSLASMWKGYYDDRIAKENEVIALIKGTGVGTTIGAKFEFAGVEEQFRKISEQAAKNRTVTEQELESLKAVYIQKLQGILPYQGGEWEEIPVVSGGEWGTDWRQRQGVMSDEQRRIEQMREESIRRIEGMGAGVTGARPEDIVTNFDQARNKALELQRAIQEIQDVKFDVESGKLVQTINEVRGLKEELTGLTNSTWSISVDIRSAEIVEYVEDQLVSRWGNKQSRLRNIVEQGQRYRE